MTLTKWIARADLAIACACMLALSGCGGSSGNNSSSAAPIANTPTYAIHVSVSGLSNNEEVTLANNGATAVTLTANGTSTFPASWPAGSAYAVTVKSHTPNITCSASQASGTLSAADITVNVSCAAGSKVILYSFVGDMSDGGNPYTGLIMDRAGNFYGTTGVGGTQLNGTVYKLASDGHGGYNESVLDSFTPASPDMYSQPTGRLVMDSSGALYGVMPYGGDNSLGAVFKLTPALNGSYTESIVYSFTGGSDGGWPYAGLVLDSGGNLYGATAMGASGSTVFKLAPNNSNGYDFSVLHTFTSGTDGDVVYGTLLRDGSGNLYGVANQAGPSSGSGTVFKLAPGGAFTVLHTFAGSPSDGAAPWGGLVMDSNGNLFGTTTGGGANSKGTVFKLTADGHGGYTESVLYSLAGGDTDGEAPYAGVVVDNQGNLFGITYLGGIGGRGVVFKLRPNGDNTYTETMLYSLAETIADYGDGYGELLLDSAGNLYGTVKNGGTHNYGYVFMIN